MDTDEFDILSAALSESGLDATMPSSSGLSSPAPVTGDACLPTASRITDRISPVRASNYSVPSTPVLKPLPAVRPQSVGRTVRVITVRKDAKGRLIVPRLNAPTSGLQPISSVPARLDNAHLLPTSSYSRAGAAGVESIQMNRSAGPSSPHSGSGAHFFSSPVGTTREHSLSPSASSFDSETSEVQTPNPCGGGSSFLHNTTSTPTSSSRYSSRQPPDIHFRTPTTSVFNSPVSHHPLHHVAQSPFHKSASTPVFPQHGTELMPADDVNDDDDDIGYSDTYSEYKPAKLQIGVRHPDPVVETSSLSAVVPPDITYRASIPEDVIDTGQLSALQLESIIYACQRHESLFPNKERAGYFVGDGAGVGKGRTLAGIIFENYLLGRRRALWFSVSSDLRLDAERDLSDIGANRIKVYPLNKFKYAKISSRENGAVKKGVVFSTYASLIGESHSAKGKYRSRIKQICHWCGGSSFDGVIIFDECHRAKNLLAPGGGKPSKTGHAVVELQKLLPKARVVYASATGATEPRHMAYMTRLGLWGPGMAFPTFQDFITAVEKRGVGAMEVVAMDMKLRGLYLARQLSFHGVSFRIEEVQLTEEFSRVFDEATKLWLDARQKFQLAADIIGAEGPSLKVMWAQFWSSHQRFFKYMCIAAKVDACVKLAKTALQNDKCVIIGLQSTGEARTLQHLAGEKNQLSGFVSTARRVFEALVTNHFPIVDSHSALRKCGLGRLYRGSAAKVKEEDEDCPFDHWLSGRPPSQGSAHESSESNNEENSSNNDSSSSGADSTTSEEEEVIDDTEQADGFNPFDNDDPDSWNVQREDLTEKSIGSSKSSVAKRALKDMGRKQKAANATAAKRPRFDISPDRSETIVNDPESLVNQGTAMRADLMNQIARLGPSLPPNTLDSLIDRLGGIENVAELTGRKGRIVSSRDGQVHYELRNENDVALEMLNVAEKERFMNGEKLIAIISEAASSGISLQADRRVANQKRRVHITLELPWSADKAIQQFGRSHRSNQVSAPEYVFLISSLAGEKRFASTVAKRLESLGALTHGDRRATESRDLSHFNIDTKYGRLALESVMRSILGSIVPLVAPPATYGGNFMHDMQSYLSGIGLLQMDTETGLVQLDKDSLSMTKFLNRLLGLPIKQQNSLFQFFADTLETVIAQARRDGRYDMGILDLGSGKEVVHKEESWTFICRGYGFGNFKTELHRVSVERGLSWDQAIEIYSDHQGSLDGFYTLNTNNSSKTQVAVLIVATGKRRLISGERLFNVYRPNTGLNTARFETETDLKRKYHKLKPRDAEELWIQQYDQSLTVCMHKYMHGRCRNETLGSPCEIGRRLRIYYLLSGSVLSIWPILDDVLACYSAATQLRTSLPRTQIVRLRTKDNKRIVGIWVPSGCVPMLRKRLSGGAPLPVIPEGFGANPIQPAGHL